MSNLIAIKENIPNKGMMFNIHDSSQEMIIQMIENPIDLLKNHRIINEGDWNLIKSKSLGGNEADIECIVIVEIMNSKLNENQSWILIKIKKDSSATMLNIFQQMYGIIESQFRYESNYK